MDKALADALMRAEAAEALLEELRLELERLAQENEELKKAQQKRPQLEINKIRSKNTEAALQYLEYLGSVPWEADYDVARMMKPYGKRAKKNRASAYGTKPRVKLSLLKDVGGLRHQIEITFDNKHLRMFVRREHEDIEKLYDCLIDAFNQLGIRPSDVDAADLITEIDMLHKQIRETMP